MPEFVSVHNAMFADATALALKTLDVFRQTKGYYNNTINAHLRGKVGEIACAHWLRGMGVECDEVFRDLGRMAETDLVVGAGRGIRLDTKTWNRRYWTGLGRCVAVDQLATLQRKTDAIIWCITPEELQSGMQVEIAGWNFIEDIANAPRRLTGPPRGRQVDNHQVDTDRVRDLAGLRAVLGF